MALLELERAAAIKELKDRELPLQSSTSGSINTVTEPVSVSVNHIPNDSIQAPTKKSEVPEAPTFTPTKPNIPPRAKTAFAQYLQAVNALTLTAPTDKQVYDKIAAAAKLSEEEEDLPSAVSN